MSFIDSKLRAMLISNTYCAGRPFLDHCGLAIKDFIGPKRDILFVPYAKQDHTEYTARAKAGFARFGINCTGIDEMADPLEAATYADAIFIGGGNTFRLLKELRNFRLIEVIRRRAFDGMPYLGASAGANVACPTIQTTNDMPIVWPDGPGALNLVPFQINPHFVDPNPESTHMGETRIERIREYHEENERKVIGLREGAWLSIEQGLTTLCGTNGAKVSNRGEEPWEWTSGPVDLYCPAQ